MTAAEEVDHVLDECGSTWEGVYEERGRDVFEGLMLPDVFEEMWSRFIEAYNRLNAAYEGLERPPARPAPAWVAPAEGLPRFAIRAGQLVRVPLVEDDYNT